MRGARDRTVSPHRPPEGRRHRLTAQACCHYAFIVSRDRKCDRGTVLASKQCSAPIQRILAISWKKGNAHALLYSVRHRPVVRGWMCPPANHNDLCEAGDNDDHLYAGGQNDRGQRTAGLSAGVCRTSGHDSRDACGSVRAGDAGACSHDHRRNRAVATITFR
jgi:hypothetical protein